MLDGSPLGFALLDGASPLIFFDVSLSSHVPFTEPSFLARSWLFFLLVCFHLIAHHVGYGASRPKNPLGPLLAIIL
jgi:hypothetical protein